MSSRASFKIFVQRHKVPGIYPRASCNEFSLDMENVMFVTKDALATSRLMSALVFSFDSFSNTDLYTLLLISTLPFLCDDLASF